jgi:ferritin-like metal-binding protein YciE
MGLFTRDLKSLEDLFKHGLQDIYYAEQQIVKALPDLIEQVTTSELKQGLKEHLKQSQNHVWRLEIVFAALGERPKGVRCKGIDGILAEGSELIGNSDGRSVIEAAVIASAQAVEHYEITRYGDLIAWAREMGRNDLVKPLRENLREEKAADRKLTRVAEAKINKKVDKTQRRGTRRSRPKGRASTAIAA